MVSTGDSEQSEAAHPNPSSWPPTLPVSGPVSLASTVLSIEIRALQSSWDGVLRGVDVDAGSRFVDTSRKCAIQETGVLQVGTTRIADSAIPVAPTAAASIVRV
jgi:hypothetical protein